MSNPQALFALSIGLLSGASFVLVSAYYRKRRAVARARGEVAAIVAEAERNAVRIRELAAQETAEADTRVRRERDQGLRQAGLALENARERVEEREAESKERETEATKLERELEQRKRTLDERRVALDNEKDQIRRLRRQARQALFERADTTRAEVVAQMAEDLVARARSDIETEMRTSDTAHEVDRVAQSVMGVAFERRDAGLGTGKVTSAVSLSSEGRSRLTRGDVSLVDALGEHVGVKLVMADSGETLHFEGQDPLEREVAKRALRFLQAPQGARVTVGGLPRLMKDIRDDLEGEIMKLGNRAFRLLRLEPAAKEIVRLVGILNWRFSYGQNQWKHAVETSWLGSIVASEMGLDSRVTRRSALLHDIGKSMTHAMDGGHAVIGAEFARRFGESEIVANAIGAHHGDEPPLGPIARLVAAADAMSGARPGARRESNDVYVERIAGLERIAGSFRGVDAAFALQGGRELRVYVSSEEVGDDASSELSRAIASQVQEELTYPGQIKVTVIRETRAVDYAG